MIDEHSVLLAEATERLTALRAKQARTLPLPPYITDRPTSQSILEPHPPAPFFRLAATLYPCLAFVVILYVARYVVSVRAGTWLGAAAMPAS